MEQWAPFHSFCQFCMQVPFSAAPSPFSKYFVVCGITHDVYRMSGVVYLNYVWSVTVILNYKVAIKFDLWITSFDIMSLLLHMAQCNCHQVVSEMVLVLLHQHKLVWGHWLYYLTLTFSRNYNFKILKKIVMLLCNIYCNFVCGSINILRDFKCSLVYGALCMW
jgi:hypothetical protein